MSTQHHLLPRSTIHIYLSTQYCKKANIPSWQDEWYDEAYRLKEAHSSIEYAISGDVFEIMHVTGDVFAKGAIEDALRKLKFCKIRGAETWVLEDRNTSVAEAKA